MVSDMVLAMTKSFNHTVLILVVMEYGLRRAYVLHVRRWRS